MKNNDDIVNNKVCELNNEEFLEYELTNNGETTDDDGDAIGEGATPNF